MPPKQDWETYRKPDTDPKDEDKIVPLDEDDIQLLRTYGQGPYAASLKSIDAEIKDVEKRVNEKMGVKESDTGLAPPDLWDIAADKQRMSEEQPLQVARCTKIIKAEEEQQEGQEPSSETGIGALDNVLGALGGMGAMHGSRSAEGKDKYVINVKQIAKFVVGLGERVAPTDIEEGMRVGYVSSKLTQRRPQQVPDSDPLAPQDRPDGHHDAGRGQAGCDVQRRRRLQGADREAPRGGRNAAPVA